ncbi:MAG: hypothetical protein JSU65_03485 [Candidatus Zixiibacteriota bacterium]|nr:MAG: hypothetical protein JSU65_03485 [candidate division Zixibacteria bacterium]
MSPARFRWGILLIQFGTLILLANLEVLNYNFLLEFVVFAAVVLILVGVEKIFTKTRLQFVSYLTSVAILAVGFAIAFESSLGGSQTSFMSQSVYRKEFSPDIDKLKAVLDFDGIDLTIRDAGTDLLYGRFDKFTRKPRIDYDLDEGVAKLNLSDRSGGLLRGGIVKIDTEKRRDWYLRFSDSVPLDLECYSEDSDIHLNLSTSHLENLTLDADDARIYLMLGDLEPFVKVSIVGDESDLKLRVPESVGLRVFGEDYGSYLVKIGLIEDQSGAFVSEGFDTLQTLIEIDLDQRLNSFSLDYF